MTVRQLIDQLNRLCEDSPVTRDLPVDLLYLGPGRKPRGNPMRLELIHVLYDSVVFIPLDITELNRLIRQGQNIKLLPKKTPTPIPEA